MSNSSARPAAKGAYNRFGAASSVASNSSTAVKEQVKPNNTSLNAYKAPTVASLGASADATIASVTLKGTRGDTFIS